MCTPKRRPVNWRELGELILPGRTAEFYRFFAAYWNLKAAVEQLESIVGIRVTDRPPYRKVAHLPSGVRVTDRRGMAA